MKIIKELSIIMGVLYLSNVIKEVSNMPIPATILGMVIMLILLLCNIVKPENIETVANFLLDNLTFLFVPGGVGLITSFGLIKGQVTKILIVAIITTATTVAVTGFTVNLLNKQKKEVEK